MDQLDQVALFHIATMLDLDNLLSLCSTNSRMNRLICQQNHIWIYKLNKDFPDWKQHFNDKNVRKIYSLLVKLSKLNEWMNYEGNIYQLFDLQALNLSYRNIKTVPPEIGSLSNLRVLYLDNNQLVTLPPEIGLLKNLRRLYLYNNQIKTFPPEIGSLRNLEFLSLDGKVKNVPTDLEDITVTYR